MAEDLWKIRERKKMSVTQLALRSGLSQDLIDDYEEGKPLTAAHRAKLAKILYVQDYDIKVQSAPRPKREKPAAPPPQPQATRESKPATPPKPAPEPQPAPPARQGQIDFLKGLAQHLGLTLQQMEDEIGKPLSELTAPEATHWIRTFQARVPPHSTSLEEGKPEGYRSQRAHLPEGVDLFEANYLLEAQQAEAVLTAKMFNGEVMSGALIGFGPYTVTLRTNDGNEVTLNKLAIAYYRRARGAA
jgi:transcriptional regulator with XRE-family HTH domain/sRNA-binding regulator protein Hfq